MASPFQGLPRDDPVYMHLSDDQERMMAPALADVGFWTLLWAAIRSLLSSFYSLLGFNECSTVATERIATAVQAYTTRPTPKKPLKLDSPESFNGQPDKVEAFLNALTLYFDGQEITHDKQRIIFALSLVKGGTGDIAGNWADLQRKNIVDHSNGVPNTVYIATWPGFVSSFTAYFQYTSSKDEAQRKLTKLQQGKGTADEFITLFKGLAPASKLDDEALLHFFKQGLNPGLRTTVFNLRPQPATYGEWLKEASTVDRTYRMSKEYSSAFSRPETQQKAKTPAVQVPQTRVERDPDAMDVDRQRDNRKCYHCGQPGHIARWCPKQKMQFAVRNMTKDERAELLKSIQDFQEDQE